MGHVEVSRSKIVSLLNQNVNIGFYPGGIAEIYLCTKGPTEQL